MNITWNTTPRIDPKMLVIDTKTMNATLYHGRRNMGTWTWDRQPDEADIEFLRSGTYPGFVTSY